MDIPNGKYAYRFDGFAMGNTILHRLVGVGVMTLNNGDLTGEHRSTLCRLSGQDPDVTPSGYSLTGTYTSQGDFGSATIDFVEQQGSPPQEMRGGFAFAPAGKDRYWLISTTGVVMTSGGIPADEIVSGEAVLIG